MNWDCFGGALSRLRQQDVPGRLPDHR
jgi:hypothetical protein